MPHEGPSAPHLPLGHARRESHHGQQEVLVSGVDGKFRKVGREEEVEVESRKRRRKKGRGGTANGGGREGTVDEEEKAQERRQEEK